ncbi:MAG: outer membrane beta-barrel protein [Cyclobacteriaceae bacterium]|nr:outer membrane beta-barrel protein [Cyclobacteriaceae bacterium]
MKQCALTLILFGAMQMAGAQSFYAIRKERSLIATIGSGTSNYFGEMVNPRQFGKTRYNILIGTEYYFNRYISGRAELTYFRLAGDDALANDDRVERNLSFFSGNLELNVTGTVNLLPNGLRFYQRPRFNAYAFAGIGLLYMNPKAKRQNGEVVALQPLETEGVSYSRFQPVIPYGIGLKYMIDPFFNVIVEGGYRKTFTDYIDDVSKRNYPDPASLKSDLSREMSDRRRERDPDYPVAPGVGVRGNPEKDDSYFLLNVKVQYYLPYQFIQSQRKLYNRKRKYYYKRR